MASILAAVEGRYPAARACVRSSEIAGDCTQVPPGRMPRLYGSQDGRRHSAANNLGMLGFSSNVLLD